MNDWQEKQRLCREVFDRYDIPYIVQDNGAIQVDSFAIASFIRRLELRKTEETREIMGLTVRIGNAQEEAG